MISTQPVGGTKFHGGGEYAKRVFEEFANKSPYKIVAIFKEGVELDDEIKRICVAHNVKLVGAKNLESVGEFLVKNKVENFYTAIPYGYGGIEIGNCKMIMTIHGLRNLECPTDKYESVFRTPIAKLKLWVRNNLLSKKIFENDYKKLGALLEFKNKLVITVSQHSKYSILNFFPKLIKEDEIFVSHSPFELLKKSTAKRLIDEPYYLMMNANRWEKNPYRAIKAFDELFKANMLANKKLLVLGEPNGKGIFGEELSSNIIFSDYLDKDQFESVIQNAFCLVYPTLNEGFGYPPLQAMGAKVPVIASAISSVTGVCKNAPLYFNPYSVSEIKNRILMINQNEILRNECIEEGLKVVEHLLELQKIHLEQLMNLLIESAKND